MKLSPSILAADFANLGKAIIEADKQGADYIHVDVMDGIFVPSISFGMPVIKAIRKVTDKPFDVHLMIEEPVRYLNDFKEAGADMITVHAEACRHLHRTVTAIKELGLKAGVALNPSTPLQMLDYVMEELDMVLLMSVNPGFGGQKYIPGTTGKIRKMRKKIDERNEKSEKQIELEVDGGICLSNLCEVIEAGTDVIVAGSAIFGGDIGENVRAFQNVMMKYEKKLHDGQTTIHSRDI